MDKTIDYSKYSYQDLISAREGIDAEKYPARAARLDHLIENFQHDNCASNTSPSKFIRQSQCKFHGNTGEFFSIWIVNLLLTIVTLGIYSAWAKVRTNRYFYSNTEVDGHRFSYLAQPMEILKGRIIAAIIFGVYMLSSQFYPVLFVVLSIALAALMPYLVVMSLRFQMRMTAYRNVKMGFNGSYGEAFATYILLPILSLFTLHLAMPWVMKKMDAMIVDNTRFGKHVFNSQLDTGAYYVAGFGSGIIAIIIFAVFMGIFGVRFDSLAESQSGEFSFVFLAFPLMYLAVYIVCSSFYQSIVRNEIFNNSQLVDIAKFDSSATIASLITLRATNFLGLILTCGLAMPWVMVRNAKYWASVTEISVTEKVDSISATTEEEGSAATEELANALDLDIALG